MKKWYVLYRTIDGRFHLGEAFGGRQDAVDYLARTAEDCRPTHRRVEFDGSVLITSYSADDEVIAFVVHEDELQQYPLW